MLDVYYDIITIHGPINTKLKSEVIPCEVRHYVVITPAITGPLEMADFRDQSRCISLPSSA